MRSNQESTTPAEGSSEWPASRIVHLGGGCRACNGVDGKVGFTPLAPDGSELVTTIDSYKSLLPAVYSLGFRIIGVDHYSHEDQVRGHHPPDWRPFHIEPGHGWDAETQARLWAQIGWAGYGKQMGYLWDLARRISHQIRACTWRLREISEAYRKQLESLTEADRFRLGAVSEDGNTWFGYWSIQSFLVDACVLRDLLCEFYAFAAIESGTAPHRSISSAGSLKRFLNSHRNGDELSQYIADSMSNDGWLMLLGSYRDLVIHGAPLASAEHRLGAVSDEIRVRDSGALRAVRFPIPTDPTTTRSDRATGSYYAKFARQLDRFTSALTGETPSNDGLEYTHESLGQLMTLSARLAAISPVEPKELVITDKDLRGKPKWVGRIPSA